MSITQYVTTRYSTATAYQTCQHLLSSAQHDRILTSLRRDIYAAYFTTQCRPATFSQFSVANSKIKVNFDTTSRCADGCRAVSATQDDCSPAFTAALKSVCPQIPLHNP